MEPFIVDKGEDEIEDYLDKYLQLDQSQNLKNVTPTPKMSKRDNPTKSITIRLSEEDINAMKTKATKLGLPYQTYIKMVIHKDACEP
jgi:predicted DNA binding CopG/RHH family protein